MPRASAIAFAPRLRLLREKSELMPERKMNNPAKK